jgi:hypothetical protein
MLAARPAPFAGPPDWREVSEALDLYALADLLTRPPGHRYFGRAVSALRKRLAAG